jgi:hypothetical protein
MLRSTTVWEDEEIPTVPRPILFQACLAPFVDNATPIKRGVRIWWIEEVAQ